MMLRGSDEHIATLHIDTISSEYFSEVVDEDDFQVEEAKNTLETPRVETIPTIEKSHSG